MNKNPLILVIAGLVLLAIAGFTQLNSGPPKADKALIAQCQQEMTRRDAEPEMIEKCQEKTFAIAITATDAESAARSISAANRGELGSHGITMFLTGLGLVLLVGGLVLRFRKRPTKT